MMSDNDKDTHDPIIETVEESDNEVGSTQMSEHADQGEPMQEIGTFNGDSPTTVDEPLPIESVALSPFRMDSVHHSPLPPRQKDAHSFSVSVSDILPPHVMEMDSPEHDGERIDEPDDCTLSIAKTPLPKISEEVDEFFIETKEPSPQPTRSSSASPPICESEGVEQSRVDEPQKTVTWTEDTSPQKDIDALSQEDMFGSQEEVRSKLPFSLTLQESSRSEEVCSQPVEEQLSQQGTLGAEGGQDILLEEDIIPATSSQRFSKEELEPFSESFQRKMSHLCAPSPVKRKRDPLEESKEALEAKIMKKSSEEHVGEEDSDIEILGESQSANQSIEVVYDGKRTQATPLEGADSQDLKLFLTADSQLLFDRTSSLQRHGLSSSQVKDKQEKSDSSPSQSLLSMPGSDRLTCPENISSSDLSTSEGGCTIGATQVEVLCPPASPMASQPNVESLIHAPIHSNFSTNQSTNSDSRSAGSVVAAANENTQDLSGVVWSQAQTPKETSVSYPQFTTSSQETQEHSESLFVRAAKAAEEKKEEMEKAKPQRKSSLEEESKVIKDDSPSFFEETASKQSLDTSQSSIPRAIASPEGTPVSSQTLGEISSQILFPRMSKESVFGPPVEEDPRSVPKVLAEDSDEEISRAESGQKSNLLVHSRVANLQGRKNSTPNNTYESPMITGLSKEEVSSIESHQSSYESDPQDASTKDLSTEDTEKVVRESESLQSVKDLVDKGWIKKGVRNLVLPPLDCWMNSLTGEVVFSVCGEDRILTASTPLESIISLAFSSSSSGNSRRISDLSSISRVTSSSAGYLGDRSSSSNQSVAGFESTRIESSRIDSTRLSIASVTALSPPNLIQAPVFLPPPAPKPYLNSDTSLVSVETQTDKIESMTTSDFPTPTVPTGRGQSTPQRRARARGRGRSRGRGRGRGRSVRNISGRVADRIPITVREDERIEISSEIPPDKESTSLASEDDSVLMLFPRDLLEKLQSSHCPLSEEEEELFLLQKDNTSAEAQKRQYDQVLKKVQEAQIEPNVLVFARYVDRNYYSAVVKRFVKDMNKWEVKYNMDSYINYVRELYILPTDILPKGLSCHVYPPNEKFSHPGIVKGHLYIQNTLFHLVETHLGKLVKAPHSHIILSAAVAEELMKLRLVFNSMIASPGRDVSLDNVVPGKRRSEASPRRGYSPHKQDSNLDTSEDGAKKIKNYKTMEGSKDVTKTKRVPVAFSDSSTTDIEAEIRPKSPRKLAFRKPTTPKTPKTPRTPRTPRTSKASGTPLTSPGPKTSKLKAKSPLTIEGMKKDEEPMERLMNPVVELLQLQEVSDSPKPTPRKRGRRPGSGSRSAKKAMKLDTNGSSDEEDIEFQDMDPRLGPLPSANCRIFDGYSILITRADKASQGQDTESGKCCPLDKEYLREQITRAGGEVIEHFDDAYSALIQSLQLKKVGQDNDVDSGIHSWTELPASLSPSKVLCVSNCCCRTAKFIQCLTIGIPLVNIEWVITSLKRNICLNWLGFLLPAGMSLLTGTLLEQSFQDCHKNPSSSIGKVVDVLRGEKVFLATSSKPGFGEMWLQLLGASGAQVFTMPRKGGNIQRLIDRRTSVVIGDSSIPDEELKRAQDLKVPVVSSEWFIQSVIARCKLPYDDHPDFHYAHKYHKVSEGADDDNEDRKRER